MKFRSQDQMLMVLLNHMSSDLWGEGIFSIYAAMNYWMNNPELPFIQPSCDSGWYEA